MTRTKSDKRSDDLGMTLVELLVYIAVSAIVLLAVSAVILTGTRGQSIVLGNTLTAGSSRSIERSMEVGIGNASDISVESPTTYGQMVRVRTAVVSSAAVTTWKCQAWFYSFAQNAMYTKSSAAAISDFSATPVLTGWTLLGGGSTTNAVTRQTVTPTPVASVTVTPAFSPVGRGGQTVSIDLWLKSQTAPKLTFSTAFGSQASPTPHPAPTEVPTSCF